MVHLSSNGGGVRLRSLMREQRGSLVRHLAHLGLRSAEIDDALQEVFLVLARKLDGVRPGCERAFLFATAARVARNARRGAARRERTAIALFESGGAPASRLEELADELLGRALLDDALDHLPDEVQLVFLLAELEGMTVPAVAERLGIPEGTVSSRLRRARARFQTWSAEVRALVDRPVDAPPRRTTRRRAPAGPKPEILSWWVQRGEVEALRALMDVFERTHPGARAIASATVPGNAVAREELSSRMLRGEPPDTFQVNGGSALRSWVRRTPAGEQMESLDFLFASEGWDRLFPADLLDVVSHRGRLYAVPLDIHRTNLLVYAPRVFAEAGLRPPATMDEVHAAAAVLEGRGVVPVALGLRDPWTLTMLAFESVLVGEAGPEYYRELCAGRRSAADVELRDALAHVGRILEYANADAWKLGWSGALDLVGRGAAVPPQTSNGGWGILARDGDPNSAGAPSWSHNLDGKTDLVAYTSTDVGTKDGRLDQGNADVYLVPYNDRAGGAATPLSGASDKSYNEYYPAWAPDDQLIAFNRVPSAASMYNQPLAEVLVVAPKAAACDGVPAASCRLKANDPVACTGSKSPGVQNTWPKWAPMPNAASGGARGNLGSDGKLYYWLTFSSTRATACTASSGGPNTLCDAAQAQSATGRAQLYVAGVVVDPASGAITTYPAIYMWNQDSSLNNLIPAWDYFPISNGTAPPIK